MVTDQGHGGDRGPSGLRDGQGRSWTFVSAEGVATGPHGPWTRARVASVAPGAEVREFRPIDVRRWGISAFAQEDAGRGLYETFRAAPAAIELLPEPARWRAWALTDPEGWEIRLTTPVPGCEPLLIAMGQGAFLGALEGVDGPHTSAIAEFHRPGEPPRCWVWDAEQAGLTLPYREGDFLMVSYLPEDGEVEHTVVSGLNELRVVVDGLRARTETR